MQCRASFAFSPQGAMPVHRLAHAQFWRAREHGVFYTAWISSVAGRGSWAAGLAKLVDAPDLGSGGENRGGSSPSARTSRGRCAGILEFYQRLSPENSCKGLLKWKSRKLKPKASSANSKSFCRPPMLHSGSTDSWQKLRQRRKFQDSV